MRSESTALFTAEDLDLLKHGWHQTRERFLAWRRRRLGMRGMLLYVASAPLMVAAPLSLATGDAFGALALMLAFVMVVVAARLNRRGILENALAQERRYTRLAWLPRQHLAMGLLASAVFIATHLAIGHDLLVSVTFSVMAAVGFFLAYQPAPLRSFSGAMPVRVDDPAVRRALQQAERQLIAIEGSALQIGNTELAARLRRIADQGRTVLSMLEQRPEDLFRVRRFLSVHLEGAERVVVGYAKSHRFLRGGVLENNFREVLGQIEQAFDQQRRQLLTRDETDLDIQIAVLRKQLRQHGIH